MYYEEAIIGVPDMFREENKRRISSDSREQKTPRTHPRQRDARNTTRDKKQDTTAETPHKGLLVGLAKKPTKTGSSVNKYVIPDVERYSRLIEDIIMHAEHLEKENIIARSLLLKTYKLLEFIEVEQ